MRHPAAPGCVRSVHDDPWADAPEAAGPAGGPDGPRAPHAPHRQYDPLDPSTRSPVVDFVQAALAAACDSGASDVHFECDRQGMAVRLRLDGVMVGHARLDPVRHAEEAISLIKVLARLDITERRMPQDGRLRFEHRDQALDMRVSIMPSVHGEDAVLRLLDKAQWRQGDQALTLEALGFDAAGAGDLRGLVAQPHGMLLITGPTGSGKTTTVYALLSELRPDIEKIVTIEDPVEYELPGVLQIPVNDRKGLSFAKGLRSILRHDPDRILVGEIRDAETAEIAVQSALTGHQVFTTVHANSVLDIVGRFRHFGLDMVGFMAALQGVVVQRLLRAPCVHCACRVRPAPSVLAWLARQEVSADEVVTAVGCVRCRGSGHQGRFAVAEVHGVDDDFRDLVTEGAPVSRLKAHVVQRGGRSLSARCAELVASGRLTPEEVGRVVGWR